jgi:hypothetical protein
MLKIQRCYKLHFQIMLDTCTSNGLIYLWHCKQEACNYVHFKLRPKRQRRYCQFEACQVSIQQDDQNPTSLHIPT